MATAKSARSSTKEAKPSAPFLGAFHSLFEAKDIWGAGRQLGVYERRRKMELPELVQATVLSLAGPPGEQTSIFAMYLTLSGKAVSHSSFYDWFEPPLMNLMAQLSARAREAVRAVEPARAPSEPASVLERLGDVKVTDSSSLLLTKLAAKWAPSTSDKHGGVKLHGIVSLGTPVLDDVQVTAQRVHDNKAFEEAAIEPGTLLMYDLGYVDHGREVRMLTRGVQLLRRLKTSENPRIHAVHRGRGEPSVAVGMRLDDALGTDALTFDEVLDLDVVLVGDKGAQRIVRVVGVPTPEGEMRWYLTSIPRTTFSAEEIAFSYSFRWEIELLWKAFKTGLGLDRLRSWRPSAVATLIHAKVTAMALARLLQLTTQARVGDHAVTQLAIVLTLARLSGTMMAMLLVEKGLDLQEIERRLLLVAETLGRSRRQKRERAKRAKAGKLLAGAR